ncbi:MAG: DUF4124 domain-containing protein [Proteobacteria bacterium]|nr:MAG: DUF4124 domain-containing protein [Pseudomonadota bacterium]
MRVAIGVLLAAGIAISTVAQAAIYRWVDDQGVVHYTETPPPASNKDRGSRIRTLSAPTGGTEQGRQRSEAIQNRLKTIEDQRKKSTEEQTRLDAETERRETVCKAARQNLANLEIRTNRRVRDSEGNITVMTEEERNEKMEEARAQIEKNCN